MLQNYGFLQQLQLLEPSRPSPPAPRPSTSVHVNDIFEHSPGMGVSVEGQGQKPMSRFKAERLQKRSALCEVLWSFVGEHLSKEVLNHETWTRSAKLLSPSNCFGNFGMLSNNMIFKTNWLDQLKNKVTIVDYFAKFCNPLKQMPRTF